jgi:hypothetical protein
MRSRPINSLTLEQEMAMRAMFDAGQGPKATAQALGITEERAKYYRDKWQYPPMRARMSGPRLSKYVAGNNKPRKGDIVCDPKVLLAPKPLLRQLADAPRKPQWTPGSIPAPTKAQLMGGR